MHIIEKENEVLSERNIKNETRLNLLTLSHIELE